MYRSQFEFFDTDGNGKLAPLFTNQNTHPSYTHVVSGGFGNSATSDLFCYDAVLGEGDFYTVNDKNQVVWVSHYPSLLRRGCTQVVVGNFGSSGYHDLLFYEPTAGVIDFYQVNRNGWTALIKSVTGVRQTWTSIVAANFGSDGSWDDIFCYDAAAGVAEFFTTDGLGAFNSVAQYSRVPRSWKQVVAGQFGGDGYFDLACYHPDNAGLTFYTVSKTGVMKQLMTKIGVPKTWTQLVSGNFGGDSWTDLMVYDAAAGTIETYSTDGQGRLTLLNSNAGLSKAWTQLATGRVKGRFGPAATGNAQVLAYNQTVGLGISVPAIAPAPAPIAVVAPTPTPAPVVAPTPAPTPTPAPAPVKGRGEVYAIRNGELKLIATHKGMRNSWTHVIAGNFGGPEADLFFYDSATGEAEIAGMDSAGKLKVLGSYGPKMLPAGYKLATTLPAAGYTPLALYYVGNGTIDIYTVDGPGKIRRLKTSDTWSKTWTQLAGGHFNPDGVGDLVVYDPAGRAAFYSQDKAGALNLMKFPKNWSTQWKQIVSGKFGGTGPQFNYLLMYNPSTGVMRLTATTGDGGTAIVKDHTGWRKTWSHMVAGNCGSAARVPMICYDAGKGEMEWFSADPYGGIPKISGKSGLPKDWTQVAAREMWTAKYDTYLFCYSRTGG